MKAAEYNRGIVKLKIAKDIATLRERKLSYSQIARLAGCSERVIYRLAALRVDNPSAAIAHALSVEADKLR